MGQRDRDRHVLWCAWLRACPTTHAHAQVGRALPAIPLGLSARVGQVGAQRLALVRADRADPSPGAHSRPVVRVAVPQCATHDALVREAGCGLALPQHARFGAERVRAVS